MKKYKRIPVEVKAEQYFPYREIEIEGFKNIVEEVLAPISMTKMAIVRRAEIVRGDKTLEIGPGDWVIEYPDGSVTIRSNRDFNADFSDSES